LASGRRISHDWVGNDDCGHLSLAIRSDFYLYHGGQSDRSCVVVNLFLSCYVCSIFNDLGFGPTTSRKIDDERSGRKNTVAG